MDTRLQSASNAMWNDLLSRVGALERGAITRRQNLFHEMIAKHFGPDYEELAALKGEAK